MRKSIVPAAGEQTSTTSAQWLNLEDLVSVEITSEDAGHPIEAALLPDRGPGWRAAGPGEQTIRVLFPSPQPLHRILLEFVDTEHERTQEFVLRWSADAGKSFHEIVRQQWNFSPQGATEQAEDLQVDLAGVTTLELRIVPDISRGSAPASLAKLRLA